MKATNILILMLLSFSLGSCNDWLDVKPTTELDRSEFFSTEAGYADALAGVYANMTHTDLYGRNLTWHMLDLMAGYYVSPLYNLNVELSDYPYKHDNKDRNDNIIAMIDQVWSKTYTQIANLNSILGTIDKNPSIFTGDNYHLIKGEALGLRAFLYFDLVRLFGEPIGLDKDSLCLPYVTELTTKVTPLITVDSALLKITADLKEARELMINDPIKLGTTPSVVLASLPGGSYSNYVSVWHNRRFHFNYYAAVATLARVSLWKGDKANALISAKEVMDVQTTRFPWVSTSNLTTIGTTAANQDRSFATEQIFALNVRKSAMNSNMDGYLLMEGLTSSLLELNADYSLYEGITSDPRYQYHVLKSTNFYHLSKLYQDNNVYAFFQERLPLIRVAEMFYIAAECAPDVPTAVGYLEAVRSNRGLTSKALPTTISDSTLRSEIAKEYRKELFGEGQLWFYYKRNLATVIPNQGNFISTALYTFDRPENEDLFGGR